MVKIKTLYKQEKGMTIIELLIYMSIFSIIMLMIISSVFYLQKIIQNNNQNYYVKNQIYYNLNILQQYLYKTHVELSKNINGQDLSFFDKENNLILIQKIENKKIKNIYKNKAINIIDDISFDDLKIELLDNDRVLKYTFSWKDSRFKNKVITEYLIVINRNM